MKPKAKRRKEIKRIRAEINDSETKKIQIQKQTKQNQINETKSWFSEKILKVHEHLGRFTKKKREKGPNK